ncbi:MAG: hypothetical protein HWE30_01050 [Methylocystaceae bacterium]|nr:hypothetical protein [Methylocystaceae bacterium]
MNEIQSLQRTAAKYLIPYLFVHIHLVWITGQVTGNEIIGALVLTTVFALIPLVFKLIKGPDNPFTIYSSSVSFMLIIAVLVYAFRGHPWQIDIHMYFFAGLAMLLGFANWKAFILATAVIAAHHLVLNLTLPYWVFPDGASIVRVLLHAVIVILETIVLVIATMKLTNVLQSAERAKKIAEEAQNQVEESLNQQKQLEAQQRKQRQADRKNVADTFEKEVGAIIHAVKGASNELQNLARGMSEAATRVGENAELASDASNTIAQKVDMVASASEQLSSSISEISLQVNEANNISSNAAELSTNSTQNVQSLSSRVSEISEVVNLISDIANQTNLLALNATIEAARAGEAGKGFAVVASEVKNLASQTAKATEQIEQQINAVVGATDDTVKGISEIHHSINQVQETATIISAAIEEQRAATENIATNATQTADDVTKVASTVNSVQEGSRTNIERSQKLLNASEALQRQADALDRQLESVLLNMRDD